MVTTEATRQRDVAVEDGVIVSVGDNLRGEGEEIDARGLVVLPGIIDVHLHFNEPGRTEWEGAATGSRGLNVSFAVVDTSDDGVSSIGRRIARRVGVVKE